MQESGLTQTLSFGLTIREGSPDDLREGCLEARRIRNEVNRLDKQGWDWDDLQKPVETRGKHVKNTTQQIIQKAIDEIQTYQDNKEDGWGRPHSYLGGLYPIRMNYGEGYNLTVDDSGDVRFRISSKPYNHVKGVLRGSADHLNTLKNALQCDSWRVGTAEVVYKHEEWRLHVSVTHKEHTVSDPEAAETVVGVDVNEDCIALAALTREGDVEDSIVIEYPDIKRIRHEYFTKRKRMQSAGQTGFETVVRTEEQDFVHDQLHKVSRDVTRWVSKFDNPVIVFEDLKDMRDSIEYGTRMNRRLHSLPFNSIQEMVTYKAAWRGIPSDKVNPEYTSQRCPRTDCLHTERANRRKKRFKCRECGFQDHADRKAAVCIVQKWFAKRNEYENVAPLDTLPRIWTVRRELSGGCGAADSHGLFHSSGVIEADSTRPETGVREELKTLAPSSG
uniref:transposase n=1 Tax=Haloprofundus sp. MHR1 TaxID=2572921 RepID=UPI001F42641E|nr:transposase [Haloprofundus sp. MHR1]